MEYYIGYLICGLVILVAVILSIFAQAKVNGTYNKYRNVASPLDMTGGQLAEELAGRYGVNITVGKCHGTLSDHYNSRTKTLAISEGNFNSNSIAAHAIVAHEFGHALQDKQGYLALKVRQTIIRVNNFVSALLVPMLIIGLLLDLVFFLNAGMIVIYAYIAVYGVSVIASLVTLPVEYNASARAKKVLTEIGCTISYEEKRPVDELLNAAAMTYVASLLVSLGFLLRAVFWLLTITQDR